MWYKALGVVSAAEGCCSMVCVLLYRCSVLAMDSDVWFRASVLCFRLMGFCVRAYELWFSAQGVWFKVMNLGVTV